MKQHTYTFSRNFDKKLYCSLTWKLSLTQTFGAALSWGCVTKVLGTRKNGTDFSHALCPASLRKERKKAYLEKSVHISDTAKMSRSNTRPLFSIWSLHWLISSLWVLDWDSAQAFPSSSLRALQIPATKRSPSATRMQSAFLPTPTTFLYRFLSQASLWSRLRVTTISIFKWNQFKMKKVQTKTTTTTGGQWSNWIYEGTVLMVTASCHPSPNQAKGSHLLRCFWSLWFLSFWSKA